MGTALDEVSDPFYLAAADTRSIPYIDEYEGDYFQ